MAEATGNSPVFYRAKYLWIVFSQVEDVFHPYDHKNIQSIKPFLAKLVTKCKLCFMLEQVGVAMHTVAMIVIRSACGARVCVLVCVSVSCLFWHFKL